MGGTTLKKGSATQQKEQKRSFFLLDFHVLSYHTYGFLDKNCNIWCMSYD